MANQFGTAEQHFIITHWKRGWSNRRTVTDRLVGAHTLGIHRSTVSRYVRLGLEAAVDATGPPDASSPSGVSCPLELDGGDGSNPIS